MAEIDAADLPIEELERNLSLYAHDCRSGVVGVANHLDLAFLKDKTDTSTPAAKALELISQYYDALTQVTTKHNTTRRQLETMPREAVRKWIAEYKKDIDESDKVLERFEEF